LFADPIIWSAAGIAFLHTALGPDHYLPFVVLGRSRGWTMTRTLWTTVVCGLGHVGSSLLLGLGVAIGSWSVASVTGWEGLRGNVAAWLFIGFGVAYTVWGIKQLSRRAVPGHSHAHAHGDGTVHDHGHDHHEQHLHPHVAEADSSPGASRRSLIAWSLFVVFVLGPCEPLIPLMMVPASQRDATLTLAVAAVFVVVTLLTMVVTVFALTRGYDRVTRRAGWQPAKFGHIAAGSTLACCGLAMLLGF
jgi:ABC-type nickel/cobalt efflux system permease component RcnA